MNNELYKKRWLTLSFPISAPFLSLTLCSLFFPSFRSLSQVLFVEVSQIAQRENRWVVSAVAYAFTELCDDRWWRKEKRGFLPAADGSQKRTRRHAS